MAILKHITLKKRTKNTIEVTFKTKRLIRIYGHSGNPAKNIFIHVYDWGEEVTLNKAIDRALTYYIADSNGQRHAAGTTTKRSFLNF